MKKTVVIVRTVNLMPVIGSVKIIDTKKYFRWRWLAKLYTWTPPLMLFGMTTYSFIEGEEE